RTAHARVEQLPRIWPISGAGVEQLPGPGPLKAGSGATRPRRDAQDCEAPGRRACHANGDPSSSVPRSRVPVQRGPDVSRETVALPRRALLPGADARPGARDPHCGLTVGTLDALGY